MIRSAQDFRLRSGRPGEPGYKPGNMRRLGKSGIIWCRFRWQGKEVDRSTGCTEERAARAQAWAIYRAEVGHGKPVQLRRNMNPTIGEIVKLYESEIVKHARINPKTARMNGRALIRILELVFPGKQVEEMRADVLTRKLVLDWREERRKRDGAEPDDLHFNACLNTELRKAQCVFSKRARADVFRKLRLPELSGFLDVANLPEPKRQWTPIPAAVLEEMDRDAAELKDTDPQLWVIYELARYGGLRSEEIQSIRRHWLEPRGKDFLIAIVQRDGRRDPSKAGFRPKSRDRRVPIAGARVKSWLKALGDRGKHDLLIQARTETERMELIQRTACAWVAKYIPERTMRLHELRKQAGSEIATRENSVAAAAEFLGDTIAVAERHYVRLLKPLKPL